LFGVNVQTAELHRGNSLGLSFQNLVELLDLSLANNADTNELRGWLERELILLLELISMNGIPERKKE